MVITLKELYSIISSDTDQNQDVIIFVAFISLFKNMV